jgi:hypothetical protein
LCFFFFFCFVFGFESEAQVSQFVSHGDGHPSERKKKIPGKKKKLFGRPSRVQAPRPIYNAL